MRMSCRCGTVLASVVTQLSSLDRLNAGIIGAAAVLLAVFVFARRLIHR